MTRSATTRLDLPLLLPAVPDQADRCVARLLETVKGHTGVNSAHVVAGAADEPARLCLHYDPDTIGLQRIEQLARQAGAKLTDRFGHLLWQVGGISHQRRADAVAARLERLAGVIEAVVTPTGPLRVEFDRERTSEAAVRAELERLGPWVEEAPPPEHAAPAETEPKAREEHGRRGGVFGERTELIFGGLSGASLAVGFGISLLFDAAGWVPLAFYVAAYIFGGYFTLREAIGSVLAGRFEIDFLMLVAAAGAAAIGEWAEGALLLFLFSLGHALEHYAMSRARHAIEGLAELAPKTAVVRRDGAIREIPVEELELGDVAVVKPNERIPADGFVVKGESSVDQAPITGESVPVDKRPVSDPAKAAREADALDAEHRVFAGTINQSGALEIQVTKKAADTTLARVIKMVNEAETQKSPTQRFTDRFERIFVPVVLAVAVLLLFAWVVIDEPFSSSFYRSMALLVAASPCALAIATPSAVLSGVARAARSGVLVKGGGPLENLGTLTAIAFDKTGTLTEGKPRLTDVVPAEGIEERELLRVAVAVEALSDHPLAAAVVRDGKERLGETELPEAHDLQSITGRGLRAKLDGEAVYIGKDELFAEIDGPALPSELRLRIEALERDGRTTMIVRLGKRYLGVLGLMDTPRQAALDVIRRLRALGIRRMVMISGDNQAVADTVARQIGLDEARGDLMPEDKVATIKSLQREAKVAMVGDGVNDAPAMANATVGIAMGAAGSDVALETADVALMADDLNHLPFAVGLSRATSRIIRQNLWLSLGVVAVLVPATILGLGIGPAVLAHEGSTVVVVFNALRLLAYRPS